MIKNIALSLPCTGQDELDAVKEPIKNGWLTQGPKVAEFEKSFSDFLGSRYAVAVTSCTTALHIALIAAGIKKGDEVIVPAFSWVSTANAVEYCGAKPVFIDIDKNTYNLDFSQIEKVLSPRTKAIIPVHLFGMPLDISKLREYLPPNIKIIEDAACAAGSRYHGDNIGSFDTISCFSFHPRKSITTGEGGMIATNDTATYELLCKLRNHGQCSSDSPSPPPYIMNDVDILGYNYRMTDIQAAIGLAQLKKIAAWIEERQKWANYYYKELSDIKWLVCPVSQSDVFHSWQAYVVRVDENLSPISRNELMIYLKENGIATRPGTQAIHMLSFYSNKYNLSPESYPKTRDCFYQTMAIPMHNKMEKDDFDYIIKKIRAL